MPFTFDPVFAVDPNNPANVAKGATITIFDPADPNQSPIVITDPTGSPLPNPITVDAAGMGPAYQHPTLARVGWKGAGFVGYFTSYEGMFNETKAAKDAAQAAASTAATAGANAAAVASEAIADAVSDAQAAATAAANAAALVNAPADNAIAAAVNGSGTATKAALNAAYVGLVQAAKNPDLLIAGAVTLNAADEVTSAAVIWPDGTPGTLTITARHSSGAVASYNITYGSPVTKTFTQPTITRNANGAATLVPQIVVS